MRYLEYQKISEAVRGLCLRAGYELPEDVLGALEGSLAKETDERSRGILEKLIENARIAKSEGIALCQDTGLAVVFVEQGEDVVIKGGEGGKLKSAINEGVAKAYEEGYFRKSVVGDPLKERKNTGTNTPAIIYQEVVEGDKLKLSVMTKGGGCENKSAFRMFRPTAEKEEIIGWVVDVAGSAGADACPPFVIGVGIGGNFEYSCFLSKKSLLRNLGERNADGFYAEMEGEILRRVNDLGIGPAGLGGRTSALGCMIETAGCHIASLPVAVNIECHSHRHKSVVL